MPGSSRGRRLVVVAFAGLLLVTLLLQLAAIDHQRRLAKSQTAKVEALVDATRRAEAAARPVLSDAERLAPDVARAGRAAAGTLSAARPLVDGLVTADAPGAVRRLDVLSTELLDADLRGVVPLLTRLDLLPRLERLQERSVRLQEESLAVQRRTLGVIEQSLAVQRETLVHARSLDRKTGGPLGE